MNMAMSDLDLFNEKFAPLLVSYNLKFRNYHEGDLGALAQIVFDSSKLGGNFDFWENGWLGIYVYDYVSDSEICNKLLSPTEEHCKHLTSIVDLLLSCADY